MEICDWAEGRTGIVSIDADFFTHREEQVLAPCVEDWLVRKVETGAPIAFHDEHVDLVEIVSQPVDFALNFDYHMDCRIEFLHGDEPRTPPCSASVFETLLARGAIERYIWAFPVARSRRAASVYASAFVTNRQPLLPRIHCVEGRVAVDQLLARSEPSFVFVCRSPGYATEDTDAIYDRLRSLTEAPAPRDFLAR